MPPCLSNKLGMDDIQRAMMCCQAIYQDGPEKVVQFLNKPENLCLHNFGEVCVSRYGRLTYMLAETDDKDELFIAFRGTQSYEDILSDLSIWQGSAGTHGESAMGGKCHAGFLKLASCFPVDPILRKYVYSRGADDCARIVVCGHSMGGAVAHIVTLNMLADLTRCGRDTNKVVSIAIGAPFFGDREMRKYAEKHELSDNLLTIVNQNDPVPRLLQLAEAFQCAAEVGTKKVQRIVNGTLPILKMSLQALSYISIGGQAIATAATAFATVDQLPTYLEDISQSVRSHMKALDDTLQYTPLGWYMLITHYRPPGEGQKNQWHVSYIEAAEDVLQAMGETWKSEFSMSKLNEHKISEYASVYPKTTSQGGRTEFPVKREAARAGEVVQYNPFVLTIEAVSLTIIGPEGSRKQKKLRMRINGKHLDFFVLGETPFTGIPADLQKSIQMDVNDDEVTLECELEEGIPFDGVPKVHITTHFDVTDIQIEPAMIKEARGLTLSESSVDHLKPAVLVKAIRQSLSNVLLASNRKVAMESNVVLKLLNRLDGQRKLVREGKDVVRLRDIIHKARTLNDLDTKSLDQVAKEILEEFGQYLKVEYPSSLLEWLTSLKGLVTIACVVVAGNDGMSYRECRILCRSGYDIFFASEQMLCINEFLRYHTKIDFSSRSWHLMDSLYTRQLLPVRQAVPLPLPVPLLPVVPLPALPVLPVPLSLPVLPVPPVVSLLPVLSVRLVPLSVLLFGTSELPEPPNKREVSCGTDDGTVYNLERALYKKYKGLEFLNKDTDEILKHKPFKGSKKLQNATKKSQKEALRRCQMACDLFEIRQHLRRSCFVGLFGPQNAGKSTLIEKVWDVAVPEKGYRVHTTVPRLYKARGTDRMVIIDFPGTTAIDKQVANLANSCGGLSSILILVMPFQGDASTDHVTQLEKARVLAGRFNCTILLCISHCGLYKVALKDKETTDAYREDYVKHLNIDPANILFTELVDSADDLESRGIVGPEGVRNLLKDWLIKYDVFEDDVGVCNGALDLSDLTMTRKASFASDSPPEIPALSANHLTKMSTALSPTGGELQPVPLDADAQEDSHDIKTLALSPDDVSATKRRIIINLLVQCFGFLLLFTAYQSLQNLQSSINRARNLGLTSLAVIYGTLIPAGPFLAPVAMRYLGLKWTITGSMVTYMIFTIANYWSEFYTVIPASILLGVGAACLWAANGAYLTRLATRYAAVTGQDKAAAISMFFGIFFCIFQTSQVWGNLISSLVLQQGAADQGAPSAANVSSCGAANCPGGGGGNLVIPPYSLRVTLISIYLACGILAVLLMALFADKEAGKGLFSCLKTCKPCGGGDDPSHTHDGQAGGSEDGEDETSPDCRHLCERFLAAWKFMFREKRMMLLIPLIMYGTMEQGVNVAIFTQAFVGCTLGIHWIGWVMICFGVCDAISALLVGRLRKWIPRQVLFGTAAVLNLALMIEMLTVKPHPSLTVLFFVHAGLWGVADGIWQTQINSLYGVLFPGQQEVAFPMDGFWGAVSYTISFAYGGYLCADVKIGILLALLIVSMATYGVVELMEKRRSKEDGETAGDATEVEKNTAHD
ncbi:PREDICTED: uncharacterized protein LOC109481058 [Branchiostoma belcheri]|uniref:Protein unc-93 homolog A n=1 Tax=Branchiostoma belcheri TaxID=7741 RepID=A0A6P5ABC2_BRABE|nr:PREDICTED: uncharacterized protein LOC109481058 [Branchiostoma belcheri]